MHHGGAPTGKEEIGIPSLFTCAVLAVVAWFSVHLVLLGLWRTPRCPLRRVPSLTDQSMVRVLRAVARHGSGDRLSRDVLTAAFSGLIRQRRVELGGRGSDAVRGAAGRARRRDAARTARVTLLERIRMTSVRAGWPGAARLVASRARGDDAAWLRRTTQAALAWARSVGLVRDHLPAPARVLLRILRVIPVVLVAQSVVAAYGLHDAGELTIAWSVAALVWWGLGRVLVTPWRTVVLTEAGRAVLAVAPTTREDAPARVLARGPASLVVRVADMTVTLRRRRSRARGARV